LYFYTTIVRPILEYASPLWRPTLTKSQAQRLEAVQHKAVNIIFCYSLFTLCFYIGSCWHSISSSKMLGSFQTFLR